VLCRPGRFLESIAAVQSAPSIAKILLGSVARTQRTESFWTAWGCDCTGKWRSVGRTTLRVVGLLWSEAVTLFIHGSLGFDHLFIVIQVGVD
jgi:hypothetical protein